MAALCSDLCVTPAPCHPRGSASVTSPPCCASAGCWDSPVTSGPSPDLPGLSLAVPFAGHWRAPSVLPRILSEESKILWGAEMDTTALRGGSGGTGDPLLIGVPPDSRKSGKEGPAPSTSACSSMFAGPGAAHAPPQAPAAPRSCLPRLSPGPPLSLT